MSGRIPLLTDGVVTLRAPVDGDVDGSVEQCQDLLTQAWTSVPVPYGRADAQTYLRHIVPGGWETDREWGFVVEALDDEGAPRFAGVVSLRNEGSGRAEVAYGAHPWARGRGVMERALRLLLGWGFEHRDLQTVLWLARRGNWASRRLAWRLGFAVTGTLPGWMEQRGTLSAAWVGTLRRDEEQSPRSPWVETPTLHGLGSGAGAGVVLRGLRPADLPRIVETRSDRETQHWLQGPREAAPHTLESHAGFIDERLESAAQGVGANWAVADPVTDAYLGQVTLSGLHHRREAELAYWTHPDARGRGVTTQACRLLVRHCFVPYDDGGLGLHRLTADAAVGNLASQHVLERVGFTRTGLSRQDTLLPDGTWTDSVTYDLLA